MSDLRARDAGNGGRACPGPLRRGTDGKAAAASPPVPRFAVAGRTAGIRLEQDARNVDS